MWGDLGEPLMVEGLSRENNRDKRGAKLKRIHYKKRGSWKFPGSPVVRTPFSPC